MNILFLRNDEKINVYSEQLIFFDRLGVKNAFSES
jgi:hypothetical protein